MDLAALIEKLKKELKRPPKPSEKAFSFLDFQTSGNKVWYNEGKKFLPKTAVLVLAGGSGSRLRFEKPKGCFPISNVKQKSLFEIVSGKVKAASQLAGCPLEMAIMTSPINREETEDFFKNHAFFGLQKSQVHFFCQELWPLLDLSGEPIYDENGNVMCGPNGNGGAFKSLASSPIYERWRHQKIEIVNVIPIDNPLADPFDCEFLGFHAFNQQEISVKATKRLHTKEKVGVLVTDTTGIKVVEYGEAKLEDEEKALAYLGLFCLNFSLIEKIKAFDTAIHKVKKVSKIRGNFIEAWKFELFLFDLFAHSKKIGVISFPREKCFAPLKNFEGEDSILTVKNALLEADRKMFHQISGIKPPEEVCFELSSEFYYPTAELIKKWLGRSIPQTAYVEAFK